MRLIRVVFINMKRHVKNPLIWAISFLLPIIVLVGLFKAPDDMSGGHIGIICNDNSAYSQELVNELKSKYTIKEYEGTAEDNYSELRKNNVGAIYVIENGFGEVLASGRTPEVKVYKTEEEIGSVIGDEIIENYINNKLEEIPWIKKNNKMNVIGIGGIAKHIGRVSKGDENYPKQLLHSYSMTKAEISQIYDEFLKLSMNERYNLRGLSRNRADIFAAPLGAILTILQYLNSEKYIISAVGLREGIIYESLL